MRILLDQLEESLESKLYFLSLSVALMVPDVFGALDSEDGRATPKRYIDWYERWIRPEYASRIMEKFSHESDFQPAAENPFDGESCYYFRCSFLHQGRAAHPRMGFSRVLFIEPRQSGLEIHYTTLQDALCIDLRGFCLEMVSGARKWLAEFQEADRYKNNSASSLRRHQDGLKPYIDGVPVIA